MTRSKSPQPSQQAIELQPCSDTASLLGENKVLKWDLWEHHSGWRRGVLLCTFCSAIVFLVNLVFLIVSVARQEIGENGQNIIFEGSCSSARSLNTGLHAMINFLSTISLSASNYCMQCMSAPTREEIDASHSAGRWLDIGVPSLRNLKWIARKRLILWGIWGLLSLPLLDRSLAGAEVKTVQGSTYPVLFYAVLNLLQNVISSPRWRSFLSESQPQHFNRATVVTSILV